MPSLLYVASKKPQDRDPKGYIGAHGRLLDRMLQQAGLTRDDVEVVWATEMPDKYITNLMYDCIVVGGDVAATKILGWNCRVSNYHGSVLPFMAKAPTSYDAYRSWLLEPPYVVVTWDILQLHASWDLHPQAMRDWQKAGKIVRGQYKAPDPDAREWVMHDPQRLYDLVDAGVVVFDTELTPNWMIGFATDAEVHVCNWGYACEQPARTLLQYPSVLKVAHNLQHDLAMCDLRFGFEVKPPYFDTYGGAHLLNTALDRDLSPGVASRFTNWPYHKWLNDVDSMHYNGMDNVVTYDAYVEIAKQLETRGLMPTMQHDLKLLEALYEMQRVGFRIDEVARQSYERETAEELAYVEDRLIEQATPVIRARIASFRKPHLFRQDRQCACCGGGKVTRAHCWHCGGLPTKPEKKTDYFNGQVDEQPAYFPPRFADIRGEPKPLLGTSHTVAELRAALPPCAACQATGKVEKWLRFRPSSDDHVADVVYRGLRIAPRKYKGKETTAAAQLKPLGARYPFVAALVEASELRANLTTVERLEPEPSTGRVHCVLNPWGTESGRVAGSEGLLRKGTNPQNIPKKARRFVVPDAGCVFLQPDMAQIEARAVAVLSSDAGLWRAFTEPVQWPGHERHGTVDSHTVVQQMVSQYVEISRDQAKRLTYAAMYGVTGKQLAIELTAEAMRKGGGVVTEAQGILMLEAFFKAFPGVRKWHGDVEQQLLQGRTVRSPSGRERHWPGRIMDKDNAVLRETLKEAWSFVPQEIAAHVLALGLLDIHTQHRDLLTPLVHIHDALLMQCPADRVEEAQQVATAALSRTCFGMWFPTDMKVGANWFEASDSKEYAAWMTSHAA